MMTEETNNKERILSTARELLLSYGIRSVSMDDIASAMGMSKKTIYQYYKDKNSLVEEVFTTFIKTNETICDADVKNAENAIHAIFLGIDMAAKMFKSMNHSLMFDLQKYHPGVFNIVSNHKQDYVFNVVRGNLIQGKKEKLYRSDVDADLMARYRVETMFVYFTANFHQNTKKDFAEVNEQIMIHFLYGLVTQKGYETIEMYKKKLKNK